MADKTLEQALTDIQCELKAPKNQYNSFGKYHYRNAEDILEALKPLLKKHGCSLTISDDLFFEPDFTGNRRVYVVAQATLTGYGDRLTVSAYAREELEKKGMDCSQVTGAASSYARKYALNGLFLIDDTKDADAQEPTKAPTKAPTKKPAKEPTKEQRYLKRCLELKAECIKAGISEDGMNDWYLAYLGETEPKSLGIDELTLWGNYLKEMLESMNELNND